MLIAAPDFQARWVERLPHADYHDDRKHVSSTGVRRVLKSPWAFKRYWVGDMVEKQTESMKFGVLVHQVVLEGADILSTYVVMPEFVGYTLDGRESAQSKQARQKKAEWLAEHADCTVVTQEELDKLRWMIDSVLSHNDAVALLKEGVTELSGYYACPDTGLAARIRPDFYAAPMRTIVDLKTARDITPEGFGRAIINHGYDTQLAMYREGAQIISGEPIEHVAFISVENEEPHETAVYVADTLMLRRGLDNYRRGMKTLRACVDADQWPQHQERMQEISLPRWAIVDAETEAFT